MRSTSKWSHDYVSNLLFRFCTSPFSGHYNTGTGVIITINYRNITMSIDIMNLYNPFLMYYTKFII